MRFFCCYVLICMKFTSNKKFLTFKEMHGACESTLYKRIIKSVKETVQNGTGKALARHPPQNSTIILTLH